MKGQVSIEFISLLSMALLASSVLITAVQDKNAAVNEMNHNTRAEQIAQKTAYKIEYVLSDQDAELELEYASELDTNYTVKITSGQVTAGYNDDTASYQTAYRGPNKTLNTRGSYVVSYDGGLKIE